MNSKRILFGLVLLVLYFMGSCGEKRNLIKYIPGESAMVLSLNIGSIEKKGDVINFIRQIAEVNKSDKNDTSISVFISHLTEAQKNSGIDFTSDSYLFFTMDQYVKGGYIMAIADFGKCISFMDYIVKESKGNIKPVKKSNYVYYPFSDNFTIFCAKEVLVLLSRSEGLSLDAQAEYFEKIISGNPDNSMLTNKDFNDFIKNSKDVNFWMSIARFKEIQSKTNPNYELAYLHDLNIEIMKLYLDFATDELKLNMDLVMTDENKAQQEQVFTGKGISKDLLKFIPGENIYAGISLVYNLKSLKSVLNEYFKAAGKDISQIDREAGFDFASLFEIFGGEFFGAITDIQVVREAKNNVSKFSPEAYSKPKEKPEIKFYVGASIAKEDDLHVLIDKVFKKGIEKQGKHYRVITKTDTLLFGVYNKLLVFTNDNRIINNSENNIYPANFSKNKYSDYFIKNDMAMFFNLNFNTYPESFKKSLLGSVRDKRDSELLLKILENLDCLTMTAKYQKVEISLKFTEKKQNSLYTILYMIKDYLSAKKV